MMYFRARSYDPTTGEFISQDPLQYVDGMSLYRAYFVINSLDPRGLTSISNKLYRGDFDTDTFAGIFKHVDKGRVLGARFEAQFTPDKNKFHDKQGCCLCDKIAWIQVIQNSITRFDGPNPELANKIMREKEAQYPAIDLEVGVKSPYYPHNSKKYGTPIADDPCLGRPISMGDAPNVPAVIDGGNAWLVSRETWFETCAVCTSGEEGPQTVFGKPGTALPGLRFKSLTNYGCIQWKHEVKRNVGHGRPPTADDYEASIEILFANGIAASNAFALAVGKHRFD